MVTLLNVSKLTLTLCALTLAPAVSYAKDNGILGKQAPEIKVDKWISPAKNSVAPTVKSLKGKIIYLYCFQAWCPGCHKSGFPALKAVSKKFKGDKEVVFIAVQTVFEGYQHNTEKSALTIQKKYQLEAITFGQSGSKTKPSAIMSDFKTRGTPWTIIIGKDGLVKYNAFHIKPLKAVEIINQLKGKVEIQQQSETPTSDK